MASYWSMNALLIEAKREIQNAFEDELSPEAKATLIAAYLNAATQAEIASSINYLASAVVELPRNLRMNGR